MAVKIPEELKKLPIEIIIILGTLALYIVANSVFTSGWAALIPLLLAGLVVIELVFFVALEVKQGVKKHGWKHEIVDTVIAILIAVLLWLGASYILNTSTPVSGVVSCSMLPNLERGDFIIVQGADSIAYEISMSENELRELTDGPMTAVANGMEYSLPMPLYSYCNCYSSELLCQTFNQHPENVVEKAGPFRYHYTMCEIGYSDSDVKGYGKCLESIEFNGKNYYTNLSNDVIVYQPGTNDLYANVGDIVHRLFFKIDVNGKNYYLTKGDNNPIMDMQVVDCNNPGIKNRPVPEENVKGKVIARVPYLGYLKLFISGLWHEDSQCRWQISYPVVD